MTPPGPLEKHNFSPLAIYFSEATFARLPGKLRESFLDAAQKAAADTRTHALTVEQEALALLKEKGVMVMPCDKEAFRQRVAPQTEAFVKQHPQAKPVVDLIRSTRV